MLQPHDNWSSLGVPAPPSMLPVSHNASPSTGSRYVCLGPQDGSVSVGFFLLILLCARGWLGFYLWSVLSRMCPKMTGSRTAQLLLILCSGFEVIALRSPLISQTTCRLLTRATWGCHCGCDRASRSLDPPSVKWDSNLTWLTLDFHKGQVQLKFGIWVGTQYSNVTQGLPTYLQSSEEVFPKQNLTRV
jgi:hypothetical protein